MVTQMRSRAYTHTTHPYGSTQSAARGCQNTTRSIPPDSRTYRRGVTHTCTRTPTHAYYAPHTSAHYPQLEDAEARHAPYRRIHARTMKAVRTLTRPTQMPQKRLPFPQAYSNVDSKIVEQFDSQGSNVADCRPHIRH